MYQKILVPLDGSPLAECVLPHVESIAKGCHSTAVTFVRVLEPFYLPGGDYMPSPKEIERIESEQKTEAENYLRNLAAKIKYDGVTVKTELLRGRAPDTLAEYATKSKADLIIIATHGRSGISRWVWGSVADRVLRSACVPLLMIRAPGCAPGA